jgi:hypothetical protein
MFRSRPSMPRQKPRAQSSAALSSRPESHAHPAKTLSNFHSFHDSIDLALTNPNYLSAP